MPENFLESWVQPQSAMTMSLVFLSPFGPKLDISSHEVISQLCTIANMVSLARMLEELWIQQTFSQVLHEQEENSYSGLLFL